MPRTLVTRLAPVLAGACLVVLHPVSARAQETGACGQTLALTELVDPALSPGFEPIRRFVQIRRSEARYLEFAVDAPQSVTVRTEAPSMDPAMALYDQTGQLLVWDDDSGGGTDALVASDLGAGRYCVQVRPIGAEPVDFAELVVVFESGLVLPPGQELPCTMEGTQDLALGLSSPVDAIALDGETDPETGRRDFRLSLAEPLDLAISVASGDFDTVLEVFDAAGAQVASNDDFAGTDSRVEQSFAAGDYCVVARSFDGGSGLFTMALSEADILAPALPCSDPARTGMLASGFGPGGAPVIVQGEIDPESLEGWFSLEVSEEASLQVDARSFALDTVLVIHDANGVLVTENDDGPDGTNSRIETALAPGSYCVTVRDYNGNIGPFDLSVVPAGMEPPVAEVGRPDPAMAADIEDMGVLGDVVRSYTVGGDATLWASFAVDAPGSVTVSGMSVSSDFSVAVFAADGTPVGEAGPVPAMSPADVAAELAAGSYLVALTNHGAAGMILRQITVTRN